MRLPGVIQMTMGEENRIDRQATLADDLHQKIRIPSGVHHQSVPGVFIPQERTVLAKWGDRQNLQLHVGIY